MNLSSPHNLPLTASEYVALNVAANKYLDSIAIDKINASVKLNFINDLGDTFWPIFKTIPEIELRLKKSTVSENKKQKFLHLNSNDMSNLITLREPAEYRKIKNQIDTHKGRLLIFSLEMKGFYKRPPERSSNFLHDAVMTKIFGFDETSVEITEQLKRKAEENNESLPGKFTTKSIEALVGTYILFRLSFNNSFPDHVASHTLKVFTEDDGNGGVLLKYTTRNSYRQFQSKDSKGVLDRVRTSEGNIYNYQNQLFFLGSTTYSHITEADNIINHSYPEVLLLHAHAADRLSVRGLTIGHYPFLSLPVSTSVYMSKLDNDTAICIDRLKDKSFSEMTCEELKTHAAHYGNTDPDRTPVKLSSLDGLISDDEKIPSVNVEEKIEAIYLGQKELWEKVNSNLKFVTNEIESKYSKMLTP